MALDNATIGARLQAARRALGLTQAAVGKQMRLAISTVSEIEAGKRGVTGPELQAFARLYHRPIAYFFDEEAQESPGFQFLFRSPDLDPLDLRSVVVFQQLTEDYAHLERLVDAPPLPHPPDYSQLGFDSERDAETLAEMERARLGLGEAPLADLLNLLDGTVGARTFLVPVDSQSWSGLVVRDQDGRPCIAVNSKDESYRRNFSLAHEYGHALVHLARPGAPLGRVDRAIETARSSADERFADAFATAFLMPRRAVLAQLEQVLGASRGTFTDYDLVHMAMRFGVSGQAMSARLVSLRQLPRSVHQDYWKHRSFKELAEALGYMEAGDWSDRVALPARFRYLALKAYDSATISLAKLAELLREDYYELSQRLQRHGETEAEARAVG